MPTMKPRRRISATAASGATCSSSSSREQLDLRLQRVERALVLEDVERRERGRAGQRVARVRVAVEERPELLELAEEALVDRARSRASPRAAGSRRSGPWRRTSGRARRPPARRRTSCRCGRSRSRPRRRSCRCRARRTARGPRAGSRRGAASIPAAPWTSGSMMTAATSSPCSRGRAQACGVARRGRRSPRTAAAGRAVEQRDAADRDRADRVAVVAHLQADELGALLARRAGAPLERHLQRDLVRRRAVVGVEDARAGRGRRAARPPAARSASSIAGGCDSPSIVVCATRSSWSRTAASIAGWRWPWTVHHSDETPSMYSLPSVS